MSGVLAVVKLNHLLDLFCFGLQSCLLEFCLNCADEQFIGNLCHLYVGEQIIEEGVEERNVLPCKFGNVHVHDGLHQDQDLLVQFLLLKLLDQFLVLLVHLVKRGLTT